MQIIPEKNNFHLQEKEHTPNILAFWVLINWNISSTFISDPLHEKSTPGKLENESYL